MKLAESSRVEGHSGERVRCLGPTHWKGHFAMRIKRLTWATTEKDVERSLHAEWIAIEPHVESIVN